MILEKGVKAESRMVVAEALTALEMGSGDMCVLATPAMVALMENAAMKAAASVLPDGQTTVGSAISTSHLRPSKIGAEIRAEAEVTEVDGRRLEFCVRAYDGEQLIGEGTHTRFVVDKERFLAKLA